MKNLEDILHEYLSTPENDYEYARYINGEQIPNVKRGMYKLIETITENIWKELESNRIQLEERKSLLTNMQYDKATISNELNKKVTQLSTIETELESIKIQLDKTTTEKDFFRKELDNYCAQLDINTTQLKQSEIKIEQLNMILKDKEEDLSEIRAEKDRIETEWANNIEILENKTLQLDEMRLELSEYTQKGGFWANFLTTNSWLIGIVAICLAANSKHLATVYQQNSPIHFQNSLFDTIFSVFVVLAYDISVLALIRNGDKGSAYFFGFSQIILTLAYAYTGDAYISQYQPVLKLVTWLCFSIGFPFALFRFSEIFNKNLQK